MTWLKRYKMAAAKKAPLGKPRRAGSPLRSEKLVHSFPVRRKGFTLKGSDTSGNLRIGIEKKEVSEPFSDASWFYPKLF